MSSLSAQDKEESKTWNNLFQTVISFKTFTTSVYGEGQIHKPVKHDFSWAPHVNVKGACFFFLLVGMIHTIIQLLAWGAVASQPHSDTPEQQQQHWKTLSARHLRHKQKWSVALPDIESVYCEKEYGVRSPGIMYCNDWAQRKVEAAKFSVSTC